MSRTRARRWEHRACWGGGGSSSLRRICTPDGRDPHGYGLRVTGNGKERELGVGDGQIIQVKGQDEDFPGGTNLFRHNKSGDSEVKWCCGLSQTDNPGETTGQAWRGAQKPQLWRLERKMDRFSELVSAQGGDGEGSGQPTPVLLPGKSHGRRSLLGCSPWGRKESDTTEWLHFHFSLSCIGEGNGNPLQYSCLENPRDWGAWWVAVHGVTQSRTGLKRLSSNSSSSSSKEGREGDGREKKGKGVMGPRGGKCQCEDRVMSYLPLSGLGQPGFREEISQRHCKNKRLLTGDGVGALARTGSGCWNQRPSRRAAWLGVLWPAEPLEGQRAEGHTELPGTGSWVQIPLVWARPTRRPSQQGRVWWLWPGGPRVEWAALGTPETTKPLPFVMFNLSLQNTGWERNLTFKMVVLNKFNMFYTPASRKWSGCPHMAPQQDLLCPRAPGGCSAAQNTETEGSGK